MKKAKSKKIKIIIPIIVILLIVAVVVGVLLFIKSNNTSKRSTGTDWGDTYLEYLQDKISNNEYENANEGSLEFIQLEENKKPTMILSYENNTDKFMEITIMDENGKTTTKKIQAENSEELDMEFLYSITNETYNWYEHEKRKDGSELFIQIEETDIKNSTEPTEDKKHEFTKEEMTEQEVLEGEIPSIPKFDEEFVKLGIKPDKTDIDLKNKDINKKELKEKVEKAVENYKPKEENITDEVKQNVDNSLKELETKKEEIKKAEEEKAKKEAEEKAKAEEEAKKKAEEEAKALKKSQEKSEQTKNTVEPKEQTGKTGKGLTVGSYHLDYGSYVAVTPSIGIKTLFIYNTGTYRVDDKVGKMTVYDDQFLKFENQDQLVAVVGNNQLMWHDLIYKLNSKSANQ